MRRGFKWMRRGFKRMRRGFNRVRRGFNGNGRMDLVEDFVRLVQSLFDFSQSFCLDLLFGRIGARLLFNHPKRDDLLRFHWIQSGLDWICGKFFTQWLRFESLISLFLEFRLFSRFFVRVLFIEKFFILHLAFFDLLGELGDLFMDLCVSLLGCVLVGFILCKRNITCPCLIFCNLSCDDSSTIRQSPCYGVDTFTHIAITRHLHQGINGNVLRRINNSTND